MNYRLNTKFYTDKTEDENVFSLYDDRVRDKTNVSIESRHGKFN